MYIIDKGMPHNKYASIQNKLENKISHRSLCHKNTIKYFRNVLKVKNNIHTLLMIYPQFVIVWNILLSCGANSSYNTNLPTFPNQMM